MSRTPQRNTHDDAMEARMVSQNDRRTKAVRSARTARRLTVRHGTPQPAAPESARSRLTPPRPIPTKSVAPLAEDATPDPVDTADPEPAPAAEPATGADSGLAPTQPTSDAPPRQISDRRWRITAWSLLVLLLGVVTAAGVFGRQWYDQRQLDNARQQALAAARQDTVDFVSISAATVDRDLQRISERATGEFKDEFTQDMAQVRAAVVENKVDSRGSALRAAIVSASRRTAVVLVAVDATVKNTNAPDGRLSHYRIQVTMANQSGRWLISQLTFVG
jgi:Mce-associated membrane protein